MKKNKKHLGHLVKIMSGVNDFPALDEYGSTIFGHQIRGTWKLFRHITRTATANVWVWNPDKETVSYPKNNAVPNLEDFATIMFHEVAHGWCYFLKDDPIRMDYPTGADEEMVCWDVSQMVCDMLGIAYQKKLGLLAYRAHLLSQTHNIEEFQRLIDQIPTHLQW